MSGPMPPAQNGRGMFGIPHGADYNPRLDPFAGMFGGPRPGGAGVPLPRPRPGATAVPGQRPAPTYTGQTQQIPAVPPVKGQERMAQTAPAPVARPVAPAAAGPVPMPRPRPVAGPPVPPPTTARASAGPPIPMPMPRPAGAPPVPVPPPGPVPGRAALPPVPPGVDPRAAIILQRIQARGSGPLGSEDGAPVPAEVPPKGNTSQAPPGKGGIGSDAAAAARAEGAPAASTPDWPQGPNYAAKKGPREDIKQVDPNIAAMAQYEQQKKELIKAILDTFPKRINYNAKQIGPTEYKPLPPPTIPRSGPHAGEIKPGTPAKVDRSMKDSNQTFYQALNVQPGDKAAANKAIAALVKQREIAPSSITPAQDRILASIGKTDAYNLSIKPQDMFKRLMPPRPEKIEIPERKKGPMDTQFELHKEFQNRTDAWRPGIATPEQVNDPAEKVVKKYMDRLGEPPKEGTVEAPTQKDTDAQSKFDKERRDKFNKEVPAIKSETDDDDDDEEN
jgi:hypothetical protein